MDKVSRALKNKGRFTQVANAFTFGDKVYALYEVINPDMPHAAVVLEIGLGPKLTFRPLLELADHSRNYHALGPEQHIVISRLGAVHTLARGAHAELESPTDEELSGMARVSATAVALLGDEGLIYTLDGDEFSQLATPTEERLLAAHFVRPDLAYAVGTFGTVLRGGVQGFTELELPGSAFDMPGKPGSKYRGVDVHAKADGTLMLGTEGGPAYLYERGELIALEGLPDDEADDRRITVAEFRGVEYWGVSGHGLFTRASRRLDLRFATGGAMCMNATDQTLTIVSGTHVYVFDGSEWVHLQFNPKVAMLVERVAVDFAA